MCAEFLGAAFGEPGFLVTAAPHEHPNGASALLGRALSAPFCDHALPARPDTQLGRRRMAGPARRCEPRPPGVEHAGVMSMVSLSHAYANAAPGTRDRFLARCVVAVSARNWVHYLARLRSNDAARVVSRPVARQPRAARASPIRCPGGVAANHGDRRGVLPSRPAVSAPRVDGLAASVWLLTKWSPPSGRLLVGVHFTT